MNGQRAGAGEDRLRSLRTDGAHRQDRRSDGAMEKLQNDGDALQGGMLWIEGKSDNAMCPVRDGNTRSDPLGSGSLLGDIRKSEVVSVLKSGKEGRSRAQESTGDGERLTGLTQSTASRWHNTRRRHQTVGSDVIEVHPTKVQVGWGRSDGRQCRHPNSTGAVLAAQCVR